MARTDAKGKRGGKVKGVSGNPSDHALCCLFHQHTDGMAFQQRGVDTGSNDFGVLLFCLQPIWPSSPAAKGRWSLHPGNDCCSASAESGHFQYNDKAPVIDLSRFHLCDTYLAADMLSFTVLSLAGIPTGGGVKTDLSFIE